MSSTHSQVSLTEEQLRRADLAAASKGITTSELVQRAIDDYLAADEPNAEHALETTFGAAPDVAVPSRDDWQRG